MSDQLWSVRETAEYLGISIDRLYQWRSRGEGPVGIKLGTGPKAAVRYRRSDIDRWLEAQRDRRPA